MFRALVLIESFLLTQREISHSPYWWVTSLVTGLGWCNDVNGVAARALSTFFDAETYALVNSNGISDHTIGRYFDPIKQTWVYFDIWPGRVLMFEWLPDSDKKIIILFQKTVRRSDVPPENILKLKRLYSTGIPRGFVHQRFDILSLTKQLLSVYFRALKALASEGYRLDGDSEEQTGKGDGQQNIWRENEWRLFLDYRIRFLINDIAACSNILSKLNYIPENIRQANQKILGKGCD